MHKPEIVLENEMRQILLDFETQTIHLISTRRSGLEIINEKEKE